ncbi:MAG: extracellular solute-binding protein [Chloroflexi bacterium]|uniref:extracellular solute-binding protein n=1 Tax=Candidatus Flexifilum breve TaxID=3140694 RepID=UPI003136C0A1|nr:extracellular solute-binding protein [Chloroflexota bacterium]
MSKRTTPLLVFVGILLVVAFSVNAQEPVTLDVMGFVVPLEEQGTPLDEAYQTFISDFETAHANVDVNALETPPEFDTQLLVDLAAGTAPDVWNQDASTFARLVDGGYLMDLRECLELTPSLNLDRFFPTVLSIWQPEADGPIYALPNDFTPMVIYYNTASFERAGVEPPPADWTWDDLIQLSQELTLDSSGRNRLDPDFDETNVVQWGFRVRKWAFEWLYRVWQNGSDVIAPDGSTVSGYLDSPESIAAITFLRDLVTEYGVSPEPTVYDQLIQQAGFLDRFLLGEFAMFDRGHWELVGLRANANYQEGSFGILSQPASAQEATVFYASGFVVNASLTDAEKQAACDFIAAATDRGYQDTKAITGIAISGNQAAAEAAAQDNPYPEIEEVFVNEVQFGRPPYGARFANWPTVEELLDAMMERILAGGDVETEVAAAVEEINRELSR